MTKNTVCGPLLLIALLVGGCRCAETFPSVRFSTPTGVPAYSSSAAPEATSDGSYYPEEEVRIEGLP